MGEKQCRYLQHHVSAGAQARPVISSPLLEIVAFSLYRRLELRCFYGEFTGRSVLHLSVILVVSCSAMIIVVMFLINDSGPLLT